MLGIEQKSNYSMMSLLIHGEGGLYAVGIVDEWNDSVIYYNSGKKGGDIEVQGKRYPYYMVSGDQKLMYMIVKDILKNGKTSRKAKWTKK